ncbi:MAG: dockerin type I repeat-containing protein, partial [Muribaculaceae bacterium]|nr:dockerin type I repeat-containing protein [Muribaculaceae bacterium]
SYDFLWIEEICKFPSFRNTIKRVWKEFMNNSILEKLKECAYEWRRLIEDAEQHDLVRWRNYASNHSQTAPQEFLNMLARKVEWLDQQWNKNFDGDVNGDDIIDVKDMTMLISYNLGDMPTGFISDCADLNQDGIIDIQDLTFLINMILN